MTPASAASTWDRAARTSPLASSPTRCTASIESAPGGMAAEAAADGRVKEGILSKALPPAGAGMEGVRTEEGALTAGAGTAGVVTEGSVIKGKTGGGTLSDKGVAGAGPKVGDS